MRIKLTASGSKGEDRGRDKKTEAEAETLKVSTNLFAYKFACFLNAFAFHFLFIPDDILLIEKKN